MVQSQSQSSRDMLTALTDATLAVAEGLSLPKTLQRIADTARTLGKTKYAALGVLADDASRLKQFITSGIEPQIMRHIHHEPTGEGLLGNIFKEGVPIRVERIQDDPRSAGFCENHPVMTSFIGVPITNRAKRIGNLYLCDKLDGTMFTDEDEEMLVFLAAHAAIAIENANLHQELQAAALRSERDRIGMELHDGVIQSIYATGMKLEILQSSVQATDGQHEQFQMILTDLNVVIDDIRNYIQNLQRQNNEQATLKNYIEVIATNFRDFSGVKVQYDLPDAMPVLTDLQRHNLMQILRETLANVAHHADADSVFIRLDMTNREVKMIIEDNGTGFDTTLADKEISGHFGLKNIQHRAVRLGGTLDIVSNDKGTTITIRFPIVP